MDNHTKIQAVGIAWFARDDYEAFRQLMPARRWHATFDQWEATAKQLVKQQESSGVRVFKAQIRSDAFAEWCRATGRDIDSKALVHYANEFAARQLAQLKTQ